MSGSGSKPGLSYLDQSNTRHISDDYSGPVLVCDIDKTYLSTHFSSFRGLMAIPFELAIDKEPIAGIVPLLRALRRGPGPESALTPLYFVSGSPVQMRRVIEKRMVLDGIDFDGITFKDQLGLLLKGRPRGIKEQIGYKLTALLLYFEQIPPKARWFLFGDDVEQDADVFTLFARVASGFRGAPLEQWLRSHRVSKKDIRVIMPMVEQLPVVSDPVDAIFIHLERGRSPDSFDDDRVYPTQSYLQTAFVLAERGIIEEAAVGAVARDLRLRGVSDAELRSQADDALKRFSLEESIVELAFG